MINKSTINAPTQQPGHLSTEDAKAVQIMEWLLPLEELDSVNSNFFGRHIQISIKRVKKSGRPLGLKLQNKLSAVVIDHDSYEELLTLRAKCIQLVEQMEQSESTISSNEPSQPEKT